MPDGPALEDEFPGFVVGTGYNPSAKSNTGISLKPSQTPKIVTEVSSMIQEKGHTCVRIVGSKLDWCMKDECEEKKAREHMRKLDNEEMAFEQKLRDEGHKCISHMESYPVQIDWCHETPCSKLTVKEVKEDEFQSNDVQKSMKERNEEQKAFAKSLSANGHTCVSIGERYPIYVGWCHQTPCTGK